MGKVVGERASKVWESAPSGVAKQEEEPIMSQGEVKEVMTQEVAELSEQGTAICEDVEFTKL
jgi:hypothetical protein